MKAQISNGAIYPYIKSVQIYVCPSSRDGQTTGLSYSMNCALAGNMDAAVQNPVDVIQLVDEAYPSDGFFWADSSANGSDQLTQIHLGGGNFSFCDGHVKFFPFSKYPIGDTAEDATYGTFKVRSTGQPRFFDSAPPSPAPTPGAFGSCAAP